MIQMLSAFDLKEGECLEEFQKTYALFVQDLLLADLIVEASPIGERVGDTPMDTDENNSRRYFSTLSFRDREGLDAAYAYLAQMSEPGTNSHHDMYKRVKDSVFTCWQDSIQSPK